MNLLATGSGRLFLNATSGSNIFFDKETNAGENIDCGNIFKWSHLQKWTSLEISNCENIFKWAHLQKASNSNYQGDQEGRVA
ncbi:hypothetical protein YC2023_110692 [Brassica napus]